MKTEPPVEVIKAVHAVYKGRTWIHKDIIDSVMEKYTQREVRPNTTCLSSLSAREKQILQLTAEALKPKDIGTILGLSVKTINAHKENIKKKLSIDTNTQLTLFALKNKDNMTGSFHF